MRECWNVGMLNVEWGNGEFNSFSNNYKSQNLKCLTPFFMVYFLNDNLTSKRRKMK